MDFFTREHDFFSIKEIESQGAKHVGVHAMQMKDLLQSLIDDGLVNSEKCGSSMVYWCFKHDKLKKLMALKQLKENKLGELKLKKEELEQEVKDCKAKRVSKKNSELKWKQLNELKKERDLLQREVDLKAFNPGEIHTGLKEKISLGEVYTDNIETLVHHFKQQHGVPREYFQAEVGIPEEFAEYPDVDGLLYKDKE